MKAFALLLPILVSAAFAGQGEAFRTRLHQVENPTYSSADVRAEIEFGRNVAAHVLGREDLLSNPQLTKYVALIGKSLALNAPRQELEFRFGILNSDAVNAYSTPGGYVFITHGALQLAKDEAELAAILAHEIAHISSRHIVNELHIRGAEQDRLNALSRMVGASGDTARVAAAQAIDAAMTLLFDKGYKVKDEMQADQEALLILAATGYDPLALHRYLQRVDEYLAVNPTKRTPTHPSSQERQVNITQLLNEEHLTSTQLNRLEERFSQYVSME